MAVNKIPVTVTSTWILTWRIIKKLHDCAESDTFYLFCTYVIVYDLIPLYSNDLWTTGKCFAIPVNILKLFK